jgi:glycosyltransferase involved in cell wall biosynthesis
MAPFLSVCIMTYNRVGTLREALESILPQVADNPEIEVMVSDNASTDETRQVVAAYCENHPRLRYSRNETNVGFDGNVVACIVNAAGDYVAYFSDDDIAPPGMIAGLLQGLKQSLPMAAYINHTPFFHDNPREVARATHPHLQRVFTNPTEYFLYTGLGFISALTLKRSEALKHTSHAVMGRGTAHVDIASRVVLTTSGPYLFDGTITVLARYDEKSGYDPLRFGAMNTTQVHIDLFNEGLLTQSSLDWHNRKTIRLFLIRLILNNRVNRRKLITAGELRQMYGRDPLFYLFAYPLALIPAPLLRLVALPARALMRRWRRWQLGRGKVIPTIRHLAPPS